MRSGLARYSFWIYFVIFALSLAGLGEGLSRLKAIQANPLNATGYSAASLQFQQIQTYAQKYGAPDCILLGNSLVQTGLNPVQFENAFQQKSGENIKCYNLAMDGSTLSSTAPLAIIIAKMYHPSYFILGIQATQFFLRDPQDKTHLAEQQLQNDSWIRYSLGDSNLQGWMRGNSALYSTFRNGALWMFPEQSNQADDDQNISPIRPEIPRVFTDAGYAPLAVYRDDSPMFHKPSKYYTDNKTDPEDFEALEQLIQFAQQNAIHLILAEMPIHTPSALVQSTMGQIKAYAQLRQTPFLSTAGLPPLPDTRYSDLIHLHVSGSMMFSQWLGAQLGQAKAAGALEDIASPAWSPTLAAWPEPAYLATLGLSQASYADYLASQAHFDLVAPDAVIFNASPEKLDRQFSQSSVGFEIDWKDGITPQERDDLFQLITVFDRMRYRDEIDGPAEQTTQLDVWRVTLDPSILQALKIQYVICRVEMANSQKQHCPSQIANHPAYQLVKSWNFDSLYEKYFLYQVVGPG